MAMRYQVFALVALWAACGLKAAEPGSDPRPLPLTRPEMKQLLEDMKGRTPRIPLPELTDEEREKLGERGSGYESRLRSLYLPSGDTRSSAPPRAGATAGGESGSRTGGFGRENEPGMTLDYAFKTSLFWIVSRTNNCQYCLGHQESKLLAAGLVEDQIAALDADWGQFSPAEQAAFAFARRFTLEPHRLDDAEIAKLKKHYTDLQILEMVLSMAGNNSINRWKEGVGVPQSRGGGNFGRRTADDLAAAPPREEAHSYLTPTSEKYRTLVTLVAPVAKDPATGRPSTRTVFARQKLESPADVKKALEQCAQRTPRLPLVDEEAAREALGDAAPAGPLPQWMRLVANFPQTGRRTVNTVRTAEEQGDLTPLLKAQVSWIIARQDRSWYALGQARQRLRQLGQNDDQIFELDGDWKNFAPADQAMFTVARKLAASPVVLSDDDVAAAVNLAGPRDVVQLVQYTATRASLDRITEAAGLQLESPVVKE